MPLLKKKSPAKNSFKIPIAKRDAQNPDNNHDSTTALTTPNTQRIAKKKKSPAKNSFKIPIAKRDAQNPDNNHDSTTTLTTPKKKKTNYGIEAEGGAVGTGPPTHDKVIVRDHKDQFVEILDLEKLRERAIDPALSEKERKNIQHKVSRAIELKQKEIERDEQTLKEVEKSTHDFEKIQIRSGLQELTEKWLYVAQDALRQLRAKAVRETTLLQLMNGLGIEPELLNYDSENDDFK